MTDPETNEATMTAALQPFGWTCGPEFWERYYQDAWVFNLANAVERLVATVEEARRDAARIPQLEATIAGLTTACQKLLDPDNFGDLYANRNARDMLRALLSPPVPDTPTSTGQT